ncbi:hypothetical protein NP233_g12235 [Leucocoprinus birnbaumii]|uniref:Nephrocystin 3-like N-terminal domain-containing protein n=1 Tax=Leucocoprinus birnbaumii TaxID=56174 RepID=A0AAD5YKL7_9AGAR|nr:hypothetical protein NP233_g12235 [Leucocoprinus birnbaumii]
MSKRKADDDPHGRIKVPRAQNLLFQGPECEESGAGDRLPSRGTDPSAKTMSLESSQSLNPLEPGGPQYNRLTTIFDNLAPMLVQGVAQSESSRGNQALNPPPPGGGDSPAVAPALYSMRAHDHSTNSSLYLPVAPQPLHAISPGNPAHSEVYNVHNATFHEGSFAHARNIRIDTAYMIDYNRTEDERASQEVRTNLEISRAEGEKRTEETKVLDKLVLKAMPSAMHDSEDRAYAPRCDEQTRLTIRNHIVEWAQDHALLHILFWLSGPAAVGKSAVAQTVAETMKEMGLLGAAFFFSRPHGRSDPSVVIPTLVLQLFTSISEYRRIVSDKITQNPILLQKNRDIQFKELIIDPFLILAGSQVASNAQDTVLIILDGLDECSDRAAQSDFVAIISRHARSASRLRFLICSRPEPHLEVAFSKAETQAITIQEMLDVHDTEAQNDADKLLQKGFAEIRSIYHHQLTHDWPTPAQMHLIAKRASGHLGFVSFILRFIGDETYDDPSSQLDVCIKFLERSREPEASNPLHALDLLYTQILSDIPSAILPTTQRILAFSLFYNSLVFVLDLCAQANFLGLTQASTYSALHRLHSVIVIPTPSQAIHSPLEVHHYSFTEYLVDPARSGKFVLDIDALPVLSIVTRTVEWLDCTRGIPDISKASRSLSQDNWNQLLQRLTWKPPLPDGGHTIEAMTDFSLSSLWWTSQGMPDDSLQDFMNILETFDFNLDYSRWIDDSFWRTHFADFIRWLITLGALSAPLIKIIPPSEIGTETPNISVDHKLRENDLEDFAVPFPPFTRISDYFTVHIKLGIVNPVLLKLSVRRL